VASIVQKAGLSKGAFYVHFDSKDALIADFIAAVIRKTDLDFETIIKSVDDDTVASAVFFTLLEKAARSITEDLGYVLNKNAAIIQINKTRTRDLLIRYDKALYSAAFRLITLGIERGEFKAEYSPDAIAGDFVMTVRGFIFEWIAGYPDMDLNRRLQDHFKIYLGGLISNY
jgi:AcrR family transcriptional regulator